MQKCGRALAPCDQKLGVREQDLQRRSSAHDIYSSRGGQIAARGPNVARHSVLNGPRKHSENIFKSGISSNVSQQMLVLTA